MLSQEWTRQRTTVGENSQHDNLITRTWSLTSSISSFITLASLETCSAGFRVSRRRTLPHSKDLTLVRYLGGGDEYIFGLLASAL